MCIVNIATVFMVSIGGDLSKLGITAAIIVTFILFSVNGFNQLEDFEANVVDMGYEERTSNLSKKRLDAPGRFF